MIGNSFERGIAHILLLIFLLAGIAGGVYLIQQKTNLFSKATNQPIRFTSAIGDELSVENGLPLSRSPIIGAYIQSPELKNPFSKSSGFYETGYLYQSLLGQDGQSVYRRYCNVNPASPSGVNWDSCQEWKTAEWEFNQGVAAGIDEYYLMEGNRGLVVQSKLTGSNDPLSSRECLLDDPLGVNDDLGEMKCQAWASSSSKLGDLMTIIQGKSLQSIDHYMITPTGKPEIYQAVTLSDGQSAYVRRCPVAISNSDQVIDWSMCTNWSFIELSNLRGVGGERYVSVDTFIVREEGEFRLYQSLIDQNMRDSYGRRCKVDADKPGGVDWDNCTPWTGYNLAHQRQIHTQESYRSISNFVRPLNDAAAASTEVRLTHFKVSESPVEIDQTINRDLKPTENWIAYRFRDDSPGKKTLFVKYFYSDGSTKQSQASFNYQPYSSNLSRLSAQESWPKKIPILVLEYYPLAQRQTGNTEDYIDPDKTGDVNNSYSFIKERVTNATDSLLYSLSEASRYHGYKDPEALPSIQYTVLGQKEYKIPVPIQSGSIDKPDVSQILTEQKICDLVDNQGLQEVWIWAYQGGKLAIFEWQITGPNNKTANGSYYQAPVCNKTYKIMFFNYGRAAGNAMHTWSHLVEREVTLGIGPVFDQDFQSLSPVKRCGSIHRPPNSTKDYEYSLSNSAQSDCMDWQPGKTGQTSQISCQNWGCRDTNSEIKVDHKYYIWYWQNLPGLGNNLSSLGHPLGNLWGYHADLDSLLGDGDEILLPLPKPRPIGNPLPGNNPPSASSEATN